MPRRRFFLIIVAIGFYAGASFASRPFAGDLPDRTITLVADSGQHEFTVEIADNFETRSIGLMYRTEIGAGHGMLFDFKTSRQVSFWMKNTHIPLDMIFIEADGRIAQIAENAVPLSLETITSDGPVRFVLEVNAGVAGKIGLKPDDRARHPLFER